MDLRYYVSQKKGKEKSKKVEEKDRN